MFWGEAMKFCVYPLKPLSSTGVNSEAKEKYTEVEDCAPHKKILQDFNVHIVLSLSLECSDLIS